jgi:cytidylate kinase
MALLENARAFDPLDLEILERAHEAVWAEIVTRSPHRDLSKDEDRRQELRQRIFATVFSGVSDAEAVRDKVLASMPEFWESPNTL